MLKIGDKVQKIGAPEQFCGVIVAIHKQWFQTIYEIKIGEDEYMLEPAKMLELVKELEKFKKPLSATEREVLWCLFRNGATWDGNIPSKSGRSELIDRGLAYRDDGWSILTVDGFHAAIAAGMDKKKGTL